MKKTAYILLIIGIFMFTSCSLPTSKSLTDAINENTTSPTHNANTNNTANKGTEKDESASKDGTTTNDSTTANGSTKANGTQTQNISIKDKMLVTLYYQDREGYIIPMTRRVEKQEGIARAAINSIIDNPLNREEIVYYGVYPVLPEETQIRGLNIKDGIATIDFNSSLLNYNEERVERNIVSSIVYTLTEFQTIDYVKILINGSSKSKLKYGTDISGTLDRNNVLINSEKVNLKQGQKKVDAYFCKNISQKYTYFIPVSILYTKSSEEDILDSIINALIEPPSNSKYYSHVPLGVELLGINKKGNVLTLNFSNEIRNYGGNAKEDALIKQILYSAKQIKDTEKIKMLIEGKEGTLPEGTDISKEIQLPNEINAVME